MSAIDQQKYARQKQVYFDCLHPGHNVGSCTSKFICRECKLKHHSLKHRELLKHPQYQLKSSYRKRMLILIWVQHPQVMCIQIAIRRKEIKLLKVFVRKPQTPAMFFSKQRWYTFMIILEKIFQCALFLILGHGVDSSPSPTQGP